MDECPSLPLSDRKTERHMQQYDEQIAFERAVSLGNVSLVPKDTSVRLPSTWRDAIGEQLTNRRIALRQRQGFYGEAARVQAVSKLQDDQLKKRGIVMRCSCGRSDASYMAYSYLPKAAYYCPTCREVHRSKAGRSRELDKKWKERMAKEYV